MTFHQINGDGAGPITCSVSADGTGAKFSAMKVTTNVPGTNGRSNAANKDFPLVASLPAGTTCTGTVGSSTNVCAVKCANPAGPFGSVVLVQQGGAGGAAGTSNAAAKSSNAKNTNKAQRSGGSLAARARELLPL